MKATTRPTLTLRSKSLIDPTLDRPLELGVYDVLLPCRQFSISHKVAEVGRVSPTAEFILRLLKSVEGMKEADVAAFFGYTAREMSFVLSEVETHDFVMRRDGRLFLTEVGEALFQGNSEYPEIFEVDSRRETIGFDLIALAPEERRFLDPFELRLPELETNDATKLGAATQYIPGAFRKFYGEILSRRDPTAVTKRSLYSIDEVSAKDRFSSSVRILVQSTGLRPSVAEPNISDWRPENELEDRPNIIEAASRFIGDLKMQRPADVAGTYQVLISLAPRFLKDVTRRDGLAVERYYREAFASAGDVRSDRQTIPLLGSLFARENTRRVFEVADYGVRHVKERPALCIWIAPQVPHWGATTALPGILDQIKSRALADLAVDAQGAAVRTVALVAGRAPKYVELAFDVIGTSHSPRVSPYLEMLLLPNALVAATVALPIGLSNGLPVPLGFVSFDPEVIAGTQAFLLDHIADYKLSSPIETQLRSAISLV